MVEQTDTGWLTVLEKNGLRVATDILEDYGIDSETDLPVIDQDDFSKLTCRGKYPSSNSTTKFRGYSGQHLEID